MESKEPYAGKGYIIKDYPVPVNVYNFIRSLTGEIYTILDQAKDLESQRDLYHRFIAHVYASMMIERKKKRTDIVDEIIIPIYSRRIETEFKRGIKKTVLKKIKCLIIKLHDHWLHLSRRYMLTQEVFEKVLLIDSEYVLDAWKSMLDTDQCTFKGVNLMNGNRITSKKKHMKTALPCKNRYNYNRTKLIKDSIDCFEPCPFNPENIYTLVEAQRQVYEKARNTLKEIEKHFDKNSLKYQKAQKIKKRAQGIFLNDYTALRTILFQQPTLISCRTKQKHAVYEYQTAYTVQGSGRLTELTGGFQGASQPFKELFLPDSPILYNYDIKSSQAYLLLAELEKNGIPCQWLTDYLNGKKDKSYYAQKIGIDIATWKACFYALVMGAEVKNLNFGSTYENIYSFFDGNVKNSKRAWIQFLFETRDLFIAVEKWRDLLLLSNNKDYTYRHKVKYWKNACGMHYKKHCIDNNGDLISTENPNKAIKNKAQIESVKRKLAAFTLQGQESCFIHHLTLLCKENGIPVYKNEHDGLITGKKIHRKLVEEAAKAAKIKIPSLNLKPICSNEKRDKTIKHLGKKRSSKIYSI